MCDAKQHLKFFLITAMVVCSSVVFALNWSEVESLAREKNHDLKSAQKQLESYQWTYKKAYSSYLPQLSANLSTSASFGAAARTYSYGLSATQSIFDGLDNYYNVQSAYADLKYYESSLKKAEAEFSYNIRSAYLDLFFAQENVAILEKILEQRISNARLIALRYKSGKEDKGNLMRTQADQAQAEYDFAAAKRDLALAKLNLSQLIEQNVDDLQDLGSVEAVSQDNFDQLVKRSPSYVMAKYQLESAQIAKNATIAGFLPSVSLGANYSNRGNSWPPNSENSSWTLSLSYSFFPGGSNIADAMIYNLKLEKAEQDFKQSENDLRYSVQKAYSDFSDALEALEVKTVSLAAAKERAIIARAKYLNGLINYDDWDRIENDYVAAQNNLLTYRKAAYLAEASWYKAYGGTKK
ncbi:hypothetical protein A2291_02070 [candidate division WOR-1 bacterium RIFOXYB2_FULL_42_35]|uniref:Transporter n=1 Tax=candidate division WOR-1 bacterium RIFOXYC2_FULL_41_25 TaxID=1802586 RepID=A0A1F4TRR6_UNCSA|nr:MAG: hypothetical protein A2247_03870 [candidate division WOR-1 bacterium RIFOXYA2_FULL_41_14]OGC25187.1 MAG: hypothetical protein A2291_02070 [candidate division WOR-1 bacterium RIFOXYB2_FULL_42_35]OGC34743.1 MAG: hypothetical protein A2462_03385 [candidate division WOR-1 bacterium RIFOXYC2_FULL_41_25]OGC42044.1 MAG: hypothetical protein A2548_01300 [candidate division WOR-1 bacterium RIFOXYD2_FULL_41_8]